MNKKQGYFITFEGTEGSGKSTQIQEAAAFLRSLGHRLLILREPGGTRISEAIREILLSRRFNELRPEAELLLYLAARSQIVHEKILPALHQGYVVICDRYEDSTLAYQGYGRDFSLKMIDRISRFVRGQVVPDRTFLLDIAPEIGLKRGGRSDRMEKQSMKFHRKVRQGFLKLAQKNRRRFVVIDSSQARDKVSEIIRERLQRDLG